MVAQMAGADGVARTHIAELLRTGGREKAGYDGTCELADEFAKAYPCPADDATRCGKDAK